MSRFDKYLDPALARRRRNEKVLFGLCWALLSSVLTLYLTAMARDAGSLAHNTFTGSPLADAVGMSIVMGFSLAVVVVLVWRRVRRC